MFVLLDRLNHLTACTINILQSHGDKKGLEECPLKEAFESTVLEKSKLFSHIYYANKYIS